MTISLKAIKNNSIIKASLQAFFGDISMAYPKHFVDDEGYEWEAGRYEIPGENQEYLWRFRPTRTAPIWPKLEKHERQEWDYATNEQARLWKLKVKQEL